MTANTMFRRLTLTALFVLTLAAPASAFAFPGSMDGVQTIPDLSELFISDRDAGNEEVKAAERDEKEERNDKKERPER